MSADDRAKRALERLQRALASEGTLRSGVRELRSKLGEARVKLMDEVVSTLARRPVNTQARSLFKQAAAIAAEALRETSTPPARSAPPTPPPAPIHDASADPVAPPRANPPSTAAVPGGRSSATSVPVGPPAGQAAPGPGQTPSGQRATSGQAISGRGASGPASSGQAASGQGASGPGASGPGASGPGASGPGGSGPRVSGQAASGPRAAGQDASGRAGSGQVATGQVATGQVATGQVAAGQGPPGSAAASAPSSSPAGASSTRAPGPEVRTQPTPAPLAVARLQLVARDPEWVYAYWELEPNGAPAPELLRLVLIDADTGDRMVEAEAAPAERHVAFRRPGAGRRYAAILDARGGVLIRSSVVEVPSVDPAPVQPVRFVAPAGRAPAQVAQAIESAPYVSPPRVLGWSPALWRFYAAQVSWARGSSPGPGR